MPTENKGGVPLAIDWAKFAARLPQWWQRPIDLKRETGITQQTLMNAWHGKSIGLVPFLTICRAMKADPFSFTTPGAAS